MLIIVGSKHLGVVEATSSSWLATEFFTFYYLPVLPIGTSAFFVLPDGSTCAMSLGRFRWKSVLVGAAPTILAVALAIPAIVLLAKDGFLPTLLGGIAALLLGMGVAPLLAKSHRDADVATEVRRNLRSRWLGAPVEPSWHLFAEGAIDGRLRAFLEQRGRSASTTYRDPGSSSVDRYTGTALTDEMTDGEYLIAAATLAEMHAPADRREADANAERIWEKLFTLYPETRATEPSFGAFDTSTAALFFDATTRYPRRFER